MFMVPQIMVADVVTTEIFSCYNSLRRAAFSIQVDTLILFLLLFLLLFL